MASNDKQPAVTAATTTTNETGTDTANNPKPTEPTPTSADQPNQTEDFPHSHFNPCFCCSAFSLRFWCLIIAFYEIIFYFVQVIIAYKFTNKLEAKGEYNENVRGLYKGIRTFYPYMNRVDRIKIKSAVYLFLLVQVICFLSSIVFFVSALILRTKLILVYPAGILLAEMIRSFIVIYFGIGEYYGMYWLLQTYFLVCALGLFTQYRAGMYTRKGRISVKYEPKP